VTGAAGGGKLLCFISFDLLGRGATGQDRNGRLVIFGYSTIYDRGICSYGVFPIFRNILTYHDSL
jgi:hypothetical protein